MATSTTMNALQLVRESSNSKPALTLTKLPVPAIQPGHVLVKVAYSSIQPSDKLNAQGGFPTTVFPRIPGRDFSGVIVDGPPDRIGEEVYGTGGGALGFNIDGPHAEFLLTREDSVVAKPKTLSLLQAAAVGVAFSTAFLCLKRARTAPGDIVLVLGAKGTVGSAAVQIAKAMGAKTVLSAYRGADADVDVTDVSRPLKIIQELTNRHGVDVVVDAVGNLQLMKVAVDQLAIKGRYTWISAPRGGASTDFTLDIFQAYRKEIELIGCNTANYSCSDNAPALATLKRWFEDGSLAAKGEKELTVLSLKDAIDKGYNGVARNAVIKLSSE